MLEPSNARKAAPVAEQTSGVAAMERVAAHSPVTSLRRAATSSASTQRLGDLQRRADGSPATQRLAALARPVRQAVEDSDYEGEALERFRQVRRAIYEAGGDAGALAACEKAAMDLILEWPDGHIATINWATDGDAIYAAPEIYAPVELGGGAPALEDEGEDSIRMINSDAYEVERVLESGSTRPEVVRFRDSGARKVIKRGKDEGHLQSEFLSNQLYKAAGIPVLDAELIRVDGVLAQMTDFVEDVQEPDKTDLVTSPDFLRHVGSDMVFANWDMFKTDNWMEIGGRMVRADVGGALDYRAQGERKEEADWSPEVSEIESMPSKKDSPYERVSPHEIADSVRTLESFLTEDKIDAAFVAARYPAELRGHMKAMLLERIRDAIAWADEIYPLDRSIDVEHRWNKGSPFTLPSEEPEEPLDLAKALAEYGFNVPEDLFSLDPEIQRTLLNDRLRSGEIEPPEPGGKTGNPYETIPMVGVEEMTREDQFGEGLAQRMPVYFDRIRTGRLSRRMSDGERAAFERAAASEDIMEILDLLFPTVGNPGARGEMVWSVNKPYIFERERARMLGVEYEGEEAEGEAEKYCWIAEIFITDEMLKFLRDFAYVNNPTGYLTEPEEGGRAARPKRVGVPKPSAFMGNPTLKMEGAAGGSKDKDDTGIPNVVIKRDGFASFWRTVRRMQFVLADEHLWKFASDNAELVEAKARREREDRQRRISAERADKSATDPLDEEGFDLSAVMSETW